MQDVTQIDLPLLPMDEPTFGDDPMRHYEAARQHHPWLAKFSEGYAVHGYRAATEMLGIKDKMSAGFAGLVAFYEAEETSWGRFMVQMLLSRSGPVHDRLRASVARAFTPRSANRMRPLMAKIVSDLLDERAASGKFDFVDFASLFPVAVMCGLLGVSAEPIPRIRQSLEMQQASLTLNRELLPTILEAYGVIERFAEGLIAEREKSGASDPDALLDSLIATKNRGDLDEIELRYMLLVLLFAGYDTSKNMLGVTVHNLLEYPEHWARCAEDKAFCRKVVDEMLRYSAPTTPYRQVEEDFVYQDVLFPKGTMLVFPTFFSGRDPSAYSEPLKFDPERRTPKTPHPAFGRGPHMCLGMHIARTQLEEGLHIITQRLRNPRIVGEVTWRPFMGVWGPASLPLECELVSSAESTMG